MFIDRFLLSILLLSINVNLSVTNSSNFIRYYIIENLHLKQNFPLVRPEEISIIVPIVSGYIRGVFLIFVIVILIYCYCYNANQKHEPTQIIIKAGFQIKLS